MLVPHTPLASPFPSEVETGVQHCSASVPDPCEQPVTALCKRGKGKALGVPEQVCLPLLHLWALSPPCPPPGALVRLNAASEREKQGYNFTSIP